MDLEKVLILREERARLYEALRIPGRHGLSQPAKSAALERLREISTEIEAIERPAVTVEDPLDGLTLPELRALYEQECDAHVSGLKSMIQDTRKLAYLTGLNARVQRLEVEEAV